MLRTPWGDADALQERKLPPGRGRSREALRRDQRERLFAATIAACVRRGYTETSIEDILELSSVSRGTFYKQFEDKLDCFRALVEQLVGGSIALVERSLAGPGDAETRARNGLQAVLELCADQPDAARVSLVESYAAGPIGGAPVAAAVERMNELTGAALREIPGRAEMPMEMIRAIVGGWYQVIHGRLREQREEELPGLCVDLWKWAMSYRPPPQPLRRASRRDIVDQGATAPPFAGYSPEQRIIRAFAKVVREKGIPATTIADVVAAASISQTTFYRYFADKNDLMSAALESSGAQMIAASLPSARRAPDPLTAVRVGVEASCSFLAAERDFAWLRLVAVYSAGPAAIATRNCSGRELLVPLFDHLPELPAVAFEAMSGAIYGVLYNEVIGGRTASLPEVAPLLTYLALAPVAGADRAADVATATPRIRGGQASP